MNLIDFLTALRKSNAKDARMEVTHFSNTVNDGILYARKAEDFAKLADCTEGVHKPIGRYLINNINFSSHDPLVDVMKAAGYRVTPHPYSSDSVLVAIPVSYAHVELKTQNGKDVDKESALSQLERYHLLMKNYVDHNISSTISYQPGEIRKIVAIS